jgi:putative ABC transport system substrate-binding protein
MIRRRDVILLLGGAAAWPIAARAQQEERIRLVGIVSSLAEPEMQPLLTVLRDKLKELGWNEGRNLSIDTRLGRGDYKRMVDDANLLIGRKPDVIVAQGTPGLNAVREHSRAVPVVFVMVADPVRFGLIESLARPGGHATGFTNFELTIGGKWLELLKELSPGIARVTLISNSANPAADQLSRFIESTGGSAGLDVNTASVRNVVDIAVAIDDAGRHRGGGLIVVPDGLMTVHRELIIGLIAHHRLPAVYPFRIFTAEGGLISYGLDYAAIYQQAGVYVDRILRGTQPADLPVQAPTKFELVINMKTAKALGIEVPPMLLARADEVIE